MLELALFGTHFTNVMNYKHTSVLLLAVCVLSLSVSATDRNLCKPGVPAPPNRVNTTVKVAAIRDWMTSRNVDAFLQLNRDELLASPQKRDQFVAWASGFQGSSGTILITKTKSVLFTDTRYTLQADQELDCNWEFEDSINYVKWIQLNIKTNIVLAVDSLRIGATVYEQLLSLPLVQMKPLTNENPIADLWKEGRPELEPKLIYPLNSTFTGKTWQAKINETITELKQQQQNYLFVTKLDETAYLMNLRSTVVNYNPFFPSMAIVTQNIKNVFFFFQNKTEIISDVVLRQHFNLKEYGDCLTPTADEYGICVKIRSLTEFNATINELAASQSNPAKIWLDKTGTNYYTVFALNQTFKDLKIESRVTYIQIAKAKKNSAEQNAYTQCSMYDSAALVMFLSRLESDILSGKHYTELSAAALLATYRSVEPNFKGLSFETIAGVGENAAVIHYRPSNLTDRKVSLTEVFLLDSGGQYLGCTTDVTRTMYYGAQPPNEIREAYTRVLIGVIELFKLRWPNTLNSDRIDAFARASLWSKGKDYRHGTGHGIGLFLSVHEGPNGIGREYPLDVGSFQSIEPGFYQVKESNKIGFGIRLETITGVLEDTEISSPAQLYHKFQPVTLVPFQRSLIDTKIMTDDQLNWLNWYHTYCRTTLGPYLLRKSDGGVAYRWLLSNTEKISKSNEIKSANSLTIQFQTIVFFVITLKIVVTYF